MFTPPSPPCTTCPLVRAGSTSTPPSPSPSPTTSAKSSSSTAQQSPTPSPANAAVSSSSSNAGTIAGSVVGGVVFLVLLVLATLLYLRARKRNRTPPSSEFMNSLRDGAPPVLRLDSGAEFSPALPPEKGGGYHPAVPPPLLQNSYYTAEPQKFPDDIVMTDVPSARPSVERPLQPLRYSSQANDIATLHNPGSSVGSRRELWGSETDILSSPSPIRQSSPHADSALRFASQFSFDEQQPVHLSHSPTSLQPLRRQPD